MQQRSASPPCATLASRRPATALPGPDSHRQDRASFAGAFRHSITSSASASTPGGDAEQHEVRAAEDSIKCQARSKLIVIHAREIVSGINVPCTAEEKLLEGVESTRAQRINDPSERDL